jgi:class 3 adenylate cyclase
MIVIGTDTHKSTHTCAAAKADTGELQGELTARARKPGFRELLDWGRSLGSERIWALEDCRHVSGAFERFLIGEGERVLRVPPKLMGESRKGERARGKSDPIDALAIARAALREGPETLPAAHLDQRALDLKLLLDHREDLVRSRAEDQQRLRWHLHDLWPELEIPAGALDWALWLDRIARRLARAPQTARVRIARDLVRAVRERSRRATELDDLGALLTRFESLAFDVVAETPGRVVKLIGDEVMFVCPDGPTGARAALEILEGCAGQDLPPARAGLAEGELLRQAGDYFGPPVNRASRITQAAAPDTVVVDDAVRAGLREAPDLRLEALGDRRLRGVGPTPLWRVTREA